jgi:flavin reductase (DIM6/NTAB) family NADH-FMN oxidoreductase RutF
MNKKQLRPDTTLYPVPVVLVTCASAGTPNVLTINRIASCNAEPPMLCFAIRPARRSHQVIDQAGECVVNLPWPNMEPVGDIVGTTSGATTDKWAESGLTQSPALEVAAPLIAECPVNLECRVTQRVPLASHTLFIAEVLVVHADPAVLNARGEVDFVLARGGLAYRAGQVRERPVDSGNVAELRNRARAWRSARPE